MQDFHLGRECNCDLQGGSNNEGDELRSSACTEKWKFCIAGGHRTPMREYMLLISDRHISIWRGCRCGWAKEKKKGRNQTTWRHMCLSKLEFISGKKFRSTRAKRKKKMSLWKARHLHRRSVFDWDVQMTEWGKENQMSEKPWKRKKRIYLDLHIQENKTWAEDRSKTNKWIHKTQTQRTLFVVFIRDVAQQKHNNGNGKQKAIKKGHHIRSANSEYNITDTNQDRRFNKICIWRTPPSQMCRKMNESGQMMLSTSPSQARPRLRSGNQRMNPSSGYPDLVHRRPAADSEVVMFRMQVMHADSQPAKQRDSETNLP